MLKEITLKDAINHSYKFLAEQTNVEPKLVLRTRKGTGKEISVLKKEIENIGMSVEVCDSNLDSKELKDFPVALFVEILSNQRGYLGTFEFTIDMQAIEDQIYTREYFNVIFVSQKNNKPIFYEVSPFETYEDFVEIAKEKKRT